jgi:NitT/TauT family transport system substrate-binding protein
MNNKLRRFVVKRKVLIGIVILVIVAIIVGIIAIRNNNSKENTKEENVTIKVNEVTRSVFYAPQYVAISNGYFRDYGIDIDLTTGQRSRCSNDISIIRRM